MSTKKFQVAEKMKSIVILIMLIFVELYLFSKFACSIINITIYVLYK